MMKKKAYKFEDLLDVKSDKGYVLEVGKVGGIYGYGGILKEDDSKFYEYLDTHTFYGGGSTKLAQKKLNECGFNVELVDYETQKELKMGIYKED